MEHRFCIGVEKKYPYPPIPETQILRTRYIFVTIAYVVRRIEVRYVSPNSSAQDRSERTPHSLPVPIYRNIQYDTRHHSTVQYKYNIYRTTRYTIPVS